MAQTADIVVNQLTKHYGSMAAVDNISFSVPGGSVVGFLGPNGAGKTTTIRMLTCFMAPTSGAARVAGFDVFQQSMEVKARVGYLPENTPLYTEMRVGEYLDYRGRLRGMDRPTRQRRISEVASRCWLTDRLRSLIGTLSKGYRQRVGIADALLHNPPVLILDEPTVGLDPTQVRAARQLIADLAGQHTVLLSSHILSEVEMICQRAIIIGRGKILAQGTMDELKAQSAGHSGQQRLLVEVRGPADQVSQALGALAGVQQVQVLQNGPVCRLALQGRNDPQLRELISSSIIGRGWALRELRPEATSLEEFFVRITDPAEARAA